MKRFRLWWAVTVLVAAGACGEGTLEQGASEDSLNEATSDLTALPRPVLTLRSGPYRSYAVLTDGSMLGWGISMFESRELGAGTPGTALPTPTAVDATRGLQVVDVAAGTGHTAVLTASGDVYVWGINALGQLGDSGPARATPSRLALPAKATALAAGSSHTLALLTDGRVFAWGNNRSGQVGGSEVEVRAARSVGLSNIKEVAARGDVSFALATDGRVFAWGDNAEGALGLGHTLATRFPTRIPELTDVVQVTGCSFGGLALTRSGEVFAWGGPLARTLGRPASGVERPRRLDSLRGIRQLASTGRTAAALDTQGRVLTWGINDDGLLGDLVSRERDVPTAVALPGSVTTLTAGADSFSVLLADGSVLAWGSNRFGQLGLTSLGAATAPSRMLTVQRVSAPAATEAPAPGSTGGRIACGNGESNCWYHVSQPVGSNMIRVYDPRSNFATYIDGIQYGRLLSARLDRSRWGYNFGYSTW